MADPASKFTDEELKKVEKQLKSVYSQAYLDILQKQDEFNRKYEEKSKKYLEKVAKGEMTQAQYSDWLKGQVFQGDQWQAKKEQMINVIYNSNKTATDILNGKTKSVFAFNATYANYNLEHGAGINFGFGIYDTNTVINLVKNNPKLLPEWKIDQAKDYRWSQKKLNKQVSLGIIEGESLDKIATRLCNNLCTTNFNKMRTFARTSMTGAQNEGRLFSYENAKELNIKVKKQWMCTLDDHTRITHQKLDGQTQDIDKPFEVDGLKIRYPGDPTAEAALVFNCRCTMVGDIEDYPATYDRYDNIDGRPIKQMTYEEWLDAKTEQEKNVGIIPIKLGNADNLLAEKAQDISEYAKRLDSDSVQKFNKIFGQAEYKAAEDGSYYNPDDKAVYIKPDSLAPHTVFHESIHWMDYHADLQIVDDWGFFKNIYDEDFNITGKKWISKEVVIKEHASFSEKIAWIWGSDSGNGSLATKDLSNFEKVCGTSGNYGYGRKDLGDDMRAINAFLKKRGISKSDPDFVHFSDFISAISYDSNMGSVITGGHGYEYWAGYNGDEHRVAEITAGYQILKSLGRNDLLEAERELAPALMNLLDTEWSKLWQKL